MESSTTPDGWQRGVDAEADLALLSRARSSVVVDQTLDFGPWWYAPLLATLIGAATLMGESAAGRWNFAFAGAALLCGALVAGHDYGRRAVHARPSMRTAVVVAPIVIGIFGLLVGWGTALSTMGYDRFVPRWGLLFWAGTTCLLLLVRHLLHSVRRRRLPAA